MSKNKGTWSHRMCDLLLVHEYTAIDTPEHIYDGQTDEEEEPATCITCGDDYPLGRYALGYNTCLDCGEFAAKQVKFTVMIPYSKGAYQVVSREDIAHTNPKRTA